MLLLPKLHAPPLRAKMLPRRHLLEQLSGARDNRLIFITGPAGSGKTSLACQWMAQSQYALAWYSLDDADNDPDLFFRYLMTSQGMADRRLVAELEPWVQGHKPLSGAVILPHMVRILGQVTRHMQIVLDDYHCITCSDIHDVLHQLLSLTLPKIHFILLSRHALPFSASRVKVRNQFMEISPQQMKVSEAETEAFFTEIMPISLPKDQLQQVSRHMEGWLGGLQLFAMSQQGRDSHNALSDVLGKACREAQDYLLDEVLNSQTEKIRDFLYNTALLVRFNVELVRHISGSDDADQVLEQVYANNLFLTGLDADGSWYRYHHLFSQAIRQRTVQNAKGRCQEICRKAALWFAVNGYLEDAFRQAFVLDDLAFTADVMEELFMAMADHHEMAFSHRWLARLPDTLLRQHPYLRLQDCRIKLQLAELSNVAAILADIDTHWAQSMSRYCGPMKEQCEAYRFLLKHILPHWFDPENVDIPTLEKALERISPENKALSAFHTVVPFSYYYKGDLSAAHASLQTAHDKVFSSGSTLSIMIWYRVAATVERLRGCLHKAEAIIYQALQNFGNIDSAHVPLRFMVDLPMAWICYQRNDLDKTMAYAQTVLKYVEQTRFVYEIADVNYLLSLVYAAEGDNRRADHCMQRMQWAAGVIATPAILALADARAARLALVQGNRAHAEGWLRARQLSSEEPFSFRFAFESLAAAEILSAGGDFRTAADRLDQLRKRCVIYQMLEAVLEIDVLRAVNYFKLGEFRQAREIMRSALVFAQPQGYVQPFVDHMHWGLPVLDMALNDAGDARRAACHELMLMDGTSGVVPCRLTRREMEVLGHMAQGLKNREIADKNYISLHTVKTHAKNIFEKLNVKTRVQAVRRAQDLKII